MVRSILKTLVFCMVFISVCGYIGLQQELLIPENTEEPVETEAALAHEPEPPVIEPEPEIMFSDMELQPGDCFGIYIKGITDRDEIQVTESLGLESPVFFNHMEGKFSIVGISCRAKEGEYMYKVQVQRDGKTVASKEELLKILPKEFEKQYLEVSTAQKEQRSGENFNKDSIYTNRARSITSETPLWEETFIKPVEGRISTGFGMIRYINRKESERHSGLDIAAPRGTPVKAANNGIVRLAMMLQVTGNTVIIDHGCNVYSSYAHLDKLLVEEGAEVKKGDIIGEVGSTGFSTGPHLHWTVTIGKLYINPETTMEKGLPEF